MKVRLQLFDFKQQVAYKTEVLAGITVSLAMIPEVIAFAFVAGLSPLTGLYAAFVMGLVTAIFGGRPGMVSGAAGATAVVLVALVKSHGPEAIFATVVLAGTIQLLVGIFGWGKFIRLVPQPVMLGFVNGLAIIIFMAQLAQFKVKDAAGEAHWMQGTQLAQMAGLTLLTMAIVWLLPRFTKAIPSSLAAILVVSALVIGFQMATPTVGSLASIKGGFPPFHLPAVDWNLQTLEVIFPYALIMASVGLVESLLTLNLVDELTGTRGKGNKEAVAQGAANVISGFFSGMGGCAMIGQSLINVSAGARARLSGIVAALMLLAFIMFGAFIVEQLPMAALTGVMMMIAIGTFEWASLKMIGKMPRHDIFVGVLVAVITVWVHNLALAVLVGVIISALVFAWESARRIRARKWTDEAGVKHYELFGPLFFGSVTAFKEKFDVAGDPEEVIIDFKESRVADMSGIEALNNLTGRYAAAGKHLHLRHLSPDCRQLLQNAAGIIEVNILEDPSYKVVSD